MAAMSEQTKRLQAAEERIAALRAALEYVLPDLENIEWNEPWSDCARVAREAIAKESEESQS